MAYSARAVAAAPNVHVPGRPGGGTSVPLPWACEHRDAPENWYARCLAAEAEIARLRALPAGVPLCEHCLAVGRRRGTTLPPPERGE